MLLQTVRRRQDNIFSYDSATAVMLPRICVLLSLNFHLEHEQNLNKNRRKMENVAKRLPATDMLHMEPNYRLRSSKLDDSVQFYSVDVEYFWYRIPNTD